MPQLSTISLFNDANLVSYFKLEDTSDSKGANTLTNNGTTPFNAAQFGNGADQGTSNTTKWLSNLVAIIDPAADHSVSFWVKINTAPSNATYRLIDAEKNQATGYSLLEYIDTAGVKKLSFNASNGKAEYTVDLGTTTFHHIAIVCSSGNLTLYLDGVSRGTGTRSNDLSTVNRTGIGAKYDGTSIGSTIMDDASFFSRALTSAEVSNIYISLDLNDKTVNGNNLSNINAVADVTTSLPFVASTHAVGFTSASSQYLSAVQSTTLKPTGNFTIEGWVKTAAAVVFICVNYFENPNPAGFELFVSGGKGCFQVGKNTGVTQGTDYQQVVGATSVNDSAWHHVAGVYDGANITIFIDGVQDGQVAWTNAAAYNASGNFRIGDRNYAGSESNFADATIDGIRIWNTNRSQAQISANKSVLSTGKEANLSAYWPFQTLSVGSGFFALL